MAKTMYCPVDQRNVETEHSWNLTVLILLLIFLTLIGLIYMAVKWKRRCPICKTTEAQLMPATGPVTVGPYATPPPAVAYAAPQAAAGQAQPCPTCQKPLTWYAQHNRWFCQAENKWV
ncbi:MAG TPA: hypothetical protein VGB42_11055 [Candidatus Thermoplasmatota archaeon]